MTVGSPTIDGVANFRSLAGLTSRDGRRIREGVLYRSESLAELSDLGKQQLGELNIATICDLRSAGEVERAPIEWPNREPVAIPVETLPDARVAGEDLIYRLMADTEAELVQEVLLGNARAMPKSFGGSMKGVFGALLDPERLPLLIGCVAGKDRTGYVTALVLYALDIEWDQIAADYIESKKHFTADRLYESMVAWLDERPDPMVDPKKLHDASNDVRYLQASFDVIAEEHGSVDEYLRTACGLDDERRERLKDLLLE